MIYMIGYGNCFVDAISLASAGEFGVRIGSKPDDHVRLL